jgi:Nickel responsive protein SCO4226-like
MSSYLLEAYTPASALLEEVEARVRTAAAELSASGTPVRSIFVPEDETCFLLYEADSADIVREAARRAALPFERITAASLPLKV